MSTEQQRLTTIVELFEQLFHEPFQTRLLGGAAEPIYIPAGYQVDQNTVSELAAVEAGIPEIDICHRLYFRYDYLSSALHESAHWCIAGERRRQQLDYGYWYSPDGRSSIQQQQFEQVEIKPQALEWMFSVACGQQFRISADNLASSEGASGEFVTAVAEQARRWCNADSLPIRGRQFIEALVARFDCDDVLSPQHYNPAQFG